MRDPGKRLAVIGPAPEIADTQRWWNTPGDRPLTLRSLRGRVVLIDFWTYSCINCLRTLPALRAWDARYRRDGLTIIGMHAPEFPFERDAGNVGQAIERNGLRYPVAQDNDFANWSAYGNQYWPAKYLIDARGRVRYVHFGEGSYDRTEHAIRALLEEAGRGRLGSMAAARVETPHGVQTPESYLGAERAQRFLNGAIEPGHPRLPALRRRDRSASARAPGLPGPLAHQRLARHRGGPGRAHPPELLGEPGLPGARRGTAVRTPSGSTSTDAGAGPSRCAATGCTSWCGSRVPASTGWR